MQQMQPCVEIMNSQFTKDECLAIKKFPHFIAFRTAWKETASKKVHIEPHWFVLYAVLRDIPTVATRFGFTGISNKKKINNGQEKWNGLLKALSEIVELLEVLQEDKDGDRSASALLSFSKNNPFNATQKELKEYFAHFADRFFGLDSILNTIEFH